MPRLHKYLMSYFQGVKKNNLIYIFNEHRTDHINQHDFLFVKNQYSQVP